MKRRLFLKGAGLGAAAGIASPAIAQSTPTVTWRLASSYPKSLETLYGACTHLSESVSAVTDGKFKIQVFAAGEIVPALQVADAVTNGTVEMGHSGSYFYIGKDTAFAFGTVIPWGPNSRQMQAWLFHAGGLELLNEFYAKFNIYNLPAGNTGAQMGGWFRKEIKSVADLQGLKMRIGGLGGNVLQKMGVVPQQLGAGDIYPALERGVLDAVEFVGPYDDEKLGFARVAPYYYYPGFWDGCAELSFFINLEKWNSLPPTYQRVLKTCAMASGHDMQAKYDALNPPALKRLIAGGAQLRPLPNDILRQSYKHTKDLYAEMSAANPAFKKIYDHLWAFQQDSTRYWQISDLSFDLMSATALQQRWQDG
ncbi:TRAP transporter substrate-binding protein [Bosea sp. (in: a-proteobacteria)]|jgi:TRAP-type mannitol/chloroaromatic compound transport system substrate-binding protein|uniref:TRAP transporter substrate-binding protein n=1 Tax=Bosea sp. (in: a-proteobacteria) TaxID=1871050 RepID=UPI00403460CA